MHNHPSIHYMTIVFSTSILMVTLTSKLLGWWFDDEPAGDPHVSVCHTDYTSVLVAFSSFLTLSMNDLPDLTMSKSQWLDASATNIICFFFSCIRLEAAMLMLPIHLRPEQVTKELFFTGSWISATSWYPPSKYPLIYCKLQLNYHL